MLSEEQLKNLKKGDKVLAEVEIDRVDYSTVSGIVPVYMDGNERRKGVVFFNSSLIHLPPTKPKYDPTRRFKKGDIVRLKVVNGRNPLHSRDGYEPPRRGVIYTVEQDEDKNDSANCVLLSCAELGLFVNIHVSHIELVTPAEELIPYAIDPANTNIILKYGQKFAEFEDDDDAEDCCKMLNDDWRKEHESNIKENRA